MEPELRQLRYFVAVAERRSFTRAAEDVFVAQQALSQQIKALEETLGVRLLDRTSRRVDLTPAGAAYLADCKRLLSAASRAARHARAVAAGEVGTLRVAYTVTAVYDTLPVLTAHLARQAPGLRVQTREIFAADVCRMLRDERCDIALAPRTDHPKGIARRTVRREELMAAVGDGHPLADRPAVELAGLRDETFQLWPREMAPGYYDAVVGACRGAGFEPVLDETASGSNAWAQIAAGRGVNLVVASLAHQLPRGITLVPLAPPRPELRLDAVWRAEHPHPAVPRLLDGCAELWPADGAGRAADDDVSARPA
ncbi:LysR family transcriptional regulator [Streptomyces sp. NPDC048506]|uniref:LysR family transcriptional regulator n=1 Tax=Streptomyces sp. NPDC048506 TaxID=3155028 RepID=UPI00342F5157